MQQMVLGALRAPTTAALAKETEGVGDGVHGIQPAGSLPMLIGAVAALLAAFCWTLSSGIWRRVPTSLSALQLNLLKNLIGSLTLLPVLLWPGAWQGVSAPTLLALMLSGALGIALGDSFYFAALRRLGTRRSLTLDAGGPALSALLAQLTLAESLQLQQWLAIALISLAVLIVARQAPPGGAPAREQGLGLLCIALGLLCGLAGALLSRWALAGSSWQPLTAFAQLAEKLAPQLLRILPPAGYRPPIFSDRSSETLKKNIATDFLTILTRFIRFETLGNVIILTSVF